MQCLSNCRFDSMVYNIIEDVGLVTTQHGSLNRSLATQKPCRYMSTCRSMHDTKHDVSIAKSHTLGRKQLVQAGTKRTRACLDGVTPRATPYAELPSFDPSQKGRRAAKKQNTKAPSRSSPPIFITYEITLFDLAASFCVCILSWSNGTSHVGYHRDTAIRRKPQVQAFWLFLCVLATRGASDDIRRFYFGAGNALGI